MPLHVIVGAGAVGSATARVLADAGHRVRLVSRSGRGPTQPGIELVAAEASVADALHPLVVGAAALYNCANPQYHRWSTDWPPIAAALLAAATDAGALLVTMSNLYGYGPLDHPMTETDPLAATFTKGRVRAAMWEDALTAHRAGRVRVTEARAADYFGPGVTDQGHLGERVVPRVLRGKTVRLLGDPDAPHSWTYVPDVARALAVLGTDERAWGRPWHVPTNPARSQREMIAALADAAGRPSPRVGRVPGWVLHAAAVVSPMLRELREVEYQFDRPFVLDSSAFTETFGIGPTPSNEAIAATVAWWAGELRAAA